jgi:hypothetical protein
VNTQGFDDAFRRLSAAEEAFLRREFLAPVLGGTRVRVRIAGVVCDFRVATQGFRGFGVFWPVSHAEARLVRPAGLGERRRYLELFPMVRLILCRPAGESWLAFPAQRGDRRLRIDGLVPVGLVEEAQEFEVARSRFDGANFWFDGLDPLGDPARAAWLREALRNRVRPESLERPCLTAEERAAYATLFRPLEEAREREERARPEGRVRGALEHSGARFVELLERGDGYLVTFEVDGLRHSSFVEKGDLTVLSAGICLDGHDRQFDLGSLVGVLREGVRSGEVDFDD